uniref:Uncharacterized protein n=1 Tax=viral metagenome TaxID=1070528 RepID=A0A6C0KTP0_9ZZZZ
MSGSVNLFGSTKYVSDGQTYYPISRGYSSVACETPQCACNYGKQFYAGTSDSSYTPENGYTAGGSCSTAGSTFQMPNNLGYVCDGSNLWVSSNFNIGGNGWDSKTPQQACTNCQKLAKANQPQLSPQLGQYQEVGDCVNGVGSFYFDVQSDGDRWFYNILAQPTGNTNPALACRSANTSKPTLRSFRGADLSKGKSCQSLAPAHAFNYGSSGMPSLSVINSEVGSAITEFYDNNSNDNFKTIKMVVLAIILISILVLIYVLVSKEEKEELDFYFC